MEKPGGPASPPHPHRRIGLPLIALARELYAGWVAAGRILPWLEARLLPDTS